MRNPFTAGAWVRGDSFYGREDILERVLKGDRQCTWLAGTRRIGKTSLLKQIEYLTLSPDRRQREISLYWDMQGSADLEGFRESLLESIEDADARFAEIGILHSNIEDQGLFEILGTLRRHATAANLRLFLLCDEAEELLRLQQHQPDALARFRRFLQREGCVYTIITATHRLHLLEKNDLPDTSPFLHAFVPPTYIRELRRSEAGTLMKSGKIDARSASLIHDATNNHPYLLQLVCRRFFETGDLEKVLVDLEYDKIVSGFFSVDYDILSAAEKETLRCVLAIKEAGSGHPGKLTTLPDEQLQAALATLTKLGYVRETAGKICVANRLFRTWLLREQQGGVGTSHATGGGSIATLLNSREGHGYTGTMLGHYEIVDKIGEGGNGRVFAAKDTRLGRTLAIKILLSGMLEDQEAIARFRTEAKAASTLNHPNIATIFAIEEQDGVPYICMEFIHGRTLRDWRGHAGFDLEKIYAVSLSICRALGHAHGNGVIHRDIKPENILVTRDDEVKLTDFGLAKFLGSADEAITGEGVTVGTIAYMSPEQLAGDQVDARTDIYSLGTVLFELLTGCLPYRERQQLALVLAMMNEDAPPVCSLNRELPPRLDTVLERALARSPEKRYQTIAGLQADLEMLVA